MRLDIIEIFFRIAEAKITYMLLTLAIEHTRVSFSQLYSYRKYRLQSFVLVYEQYDILYEPGHSIS